MTLAHLTSGLGNHLWQSTALAMVSWLLAVALRKNQARARYWLWMMASGKFLVPFSLLVAMGGYLRPMTTVIPLVKPELSAAVEQITTPLPQMDITAAVTPVALAHNGNLLPILLLAAWACGFMAVAFSWFRNWRRIRAAMSAASPLQLAADVPVLSSRSLLEPGIFGIIRPVLLLPEGIADRLTRAQLNAVVTHEMCHVRRRDNLTAAIHMAVESIFWFHPMVWWIGAHMVEERERACDEEVLRLGGDPEVYAEGILNVCRFYVESPLTCVSGISGSDLKKRIVRIMTQPLANKLTSSKKLVLAAIGLTAVAGPFMFGIVSTPEVRAQQGAEVPLPSFEAASIKPNHSGTPNHLFGRPSPDRFTTTNIRAKDMIRFAYNLKPFQISGGPGWIDSVGYDVDAKIDDSLVPELQKLPRDQQLVQIRLMLRSLLADRFKLKISHDAKDLPIYALVVAKGGPKLAPTTFSPPDPNPSGAQQNGPHLMLSRGKISAVAQPLSGLADLLALVPDLGDRLVVDQTGIEGNYDFELEFTQEIVIRKGPQAMDNAPSPDPSLPSIFTALEDQLGLRLESTKGPVETYVIEHIEEPSPN
jgi:uncharacterized protein (TIGR03435 family)